MSHRAVGRAMLVAGVLIFLISAASDQLGIGGAPGIGWKQTSGIVIGVLLAGAGMTRLRRSAG